MAELRQTPLYATHVKSGGKMIEFGEWLLPVQYSGIKEEHQAVRKRAGLFDVSHMGEILVEGRDAVAFLQYLVTNDVARLANGQIQYTPMCYQDGGTVDDLLVYRLGDKAFLLVVNAANTAKDFAWIRECAAGFAVQLTDKSAETAQLALQGPAAGAILAKLTAAPLGKLEYYWFIQDAEVAGKRVLLSRTGYTGEDGFEIYCRPEDACQLWDALLAAGGAEGILPAGLGSRDTLRFEACFPLYGHELSAQITPLEAGLAPFVKLDKPDFVGQKALAGQKLEGLKRRIAAFVLKDRAIARAGYPVFFEGRPIGAVTSGSYAPTLEKSMGLALIEAEYAKAGREISVEIRGRQVPAEVVPKPFYKREGK